MNGIGGKSMRGRSTKVVSDPKIMTPQDLMAVAKTIYGEARGDSYIGKKAVARVMYNRWKSNTGQWRKDTTLTKTVKRKWQFSCWNKKDPNRPKILAITLKSKVFRSCMMAALEAFDEKDPTKGSRHYMTVGRRRKGWPTSWGKERQPAVGQIGKHLFYKGIP